MNYMRRLLCILLVIFYLGASGGVVLYSHYCNESLTSVSLVNADADCICPNHTVAEEGCDCNEAASDCGDCRSNVEVLKADITQMFAQESMQCPSADFQYFTTLDLDLLKWKTLVSTSVNTQNINAPPIPNYKEEAFIIFCNILI